LNTQSHPALELNGLGISFGQRVVLDGITLSLLPTGIDVLMGPVKSGKSTLFRTLAGFYEGHSLHKSWGNVAIYGESVSPENRPKLVMQHTKTLDLSLLQALLQPIRETEQRSSSEWRRAGLEWLNEYGLGDFVSKADQPLLHCHTHVQRSVQILSQVLLKPSLLMVDEPTFGLNDEDSAWLVDWMKNLSTHCKLWVALHNQLQARRLADRIMLIGGGRLLAYQNTQEFFQRPANEWVEQFIRTGGLTLPSPDARAQDLADDIPAPPPLSKAAQQAIQSFSKPPNNVPRQEKPVVHVSDITGSFKAQVVYPVSAERRRVEDNPQIHSGPDRRRLVEISAPDHNKTEPASAAERNPLVEIPEPSRDGVELASAVGECILRDSSAPRGFHWIVPGKLAGCPAPGVSAPIDYDLSLLARVGITKLITLTETDIDQEALRRHFLSNIHLSVFDREAPSIGQTHMLLVRMQKLIEAGEVLAVHCKAGLGRTGTILAAWLIREGGLTADDSMARLRRIERGFIQSKDQEEFLHRYEADLTRRLI
jgi:atypical dual specificity phosphatase